MSEELENNDVVSPENARQEIIRQMMDQWADGKLTDAQDTFNSIMNVRADELVGDRKAEISASIYNDSDDQDYDFDEEEPEEVPEEEQQEPEEPAEVEDHEEV